MPELPEVETIRRGLSQMIVGCKITNFWTDSPKQVHPSLEIMDKAIVGTTIEKIERRAKILQIFLDNGKILAIHLKLTGRLIVRKKSAPKDDWQHIVLSLRVATLLRNDAEINLELRFCDARKFGWLRLLENLGELEKLAGYGPEPFDSLLLASFGAAQDKQGKTLLNPAFTPDYLQKIFSKSSKPVKVVIMDQEKIAGVGNIYANDALFLAKVDPRTPSKQLNNLAIQQLFNALETVLKRGLQYGGASDQYYLNAKGEKGFYQEHFLVYGKTGKPCPNKCGGIIKRIVVGGRGTFYCTKCQS